VFRCDSPWQNRHIALGLNKILSNGPCNPVYFDARELQGAIRYSFSGSEDMLTSAALRAQRSPFVRPISMLLLAAA
jgi:hypothetical protein